MHVDVLGAEGASHLNLGSCLVTICKAEYNPSSMREYDDNYRIVRILEVSSYALRISFVCGGQVVRLPRVNMIN
jgi:hypothetical protein